MMKYKETFRVAHARLLFNIFAKDNHPVASVLNQFSYTGDTYKTFSKDGESDRLSTQAEEWTFCSSEGLRDFMTVLALCFHSVFEGLALGLADEDHEVWELLGGTLT